MDFLQMVKSGFMGFALSLGVLILVFYVSGAFLGVTRKWYVRVLTLGGIASFVAVYILLKYKLSNTPEALTPIYFAAYVGGWLGGLFSGMTQMKSTLTKLLRE
ncbi:hypothetical protein ACFL2Q_07865 [Thermodesulfobacteriota bacterium]